MNTITKMLLTAALIAAGGCAKEAGDQPAPTDPQAQPQPAPVQIPDEALPVATDFEDDAEKQISAENYKSELDTLEQEIAAE
jgi:hypothetical protein